MKKLEKLVAEYAMKYRGNYYRLAYSYVKNEQDALEIIQESIYKALSSIHSLKNPNSIKTWLYRIVVNTSLDCIRKKKRNVAVGEEVFAGFDLGAVDNYEDFDLKKALDKLPEKYRTVVILRYFEDLKIEEIAEILDENTNTVKTRLYKSLEKLRINLSEEV